MTEAPAAHLEPWIPRLRTELGAGRRRRRPAAGRILRPRAASRRCAIRRRSAGSATTPLIELVGFLVDAHATSTTRASDSPAPTYGLGVAANDARGFVDAGPRRCDRARRRRGSRHHRVRRRDGDVAAARVAARAAARGTRRAAARIRRRGADARADAATRELAHDRRDPRRGVRLRTARRAVLAVAEPARDPSGDRRDGHRVRAAASAGLALRGPPATRDLARPRRRQRQHARRDEHRRSAGDPLPAVGPRLRSRRRAPT